MDGIECSTIIRAAAQLLSPRDGYDHARPRRLGSDADAVCSPRQTSLPAGSHRGDVSGLRLPVHPGPLELSAQPSRLDAFLHRDAFLRPGSRSDRAARLPPGASAGALALLRGGNREPHPARLGHIFRHDVLRPDFTDPLFARLGLHPGPGAHRPRGGLAWRRSRLAKGGPEGRGGGGSAALLLHRILRRSASEGFSEILSSLSDFYPPPQRAVILQFAKPAESRLLAAARALPDVRTYLAFARFPLATVDPQPDGSAAITWEDLRFLPWFSGPWQRDQKTGLRRQPFLYRVRLDAAGRVLDRTFVATSRFVRRSAFARDLRP